MSSTTSTFSAEQLKATVPLALRKMSPKELVKTPVMFLVEVGAVFTFIIACTQPTLFSFSISLWLWATVFFATFAEAFAEGRGKAQADALRRSRTTTTARRITSTVLVTAGSGSGRTNVELSPANYETEEVPSTELAKEDVVLVEAGQTIPADGDVIVGAASVDESAVTGESAPVIRESGGDRCAVTGGTRVLSDWVVIKVTNEPGQSFMDRMIGLVEGANRQRTPNELALSTLLNVLTLIFLLVVMALAPTAAFNGAAQDPLVLVALLVCLIPTTIGALLSAIGIAGMDRLVQHNVLAMSGRAVEAAGDVSTLLLDKTGTITVGDRQAVNVIPVGGYDQDELLYKVQLSSMADETPEGRSIVKLAEAARGEMPEEHFRNLEFIAFTAQTRMSGVKLSDSEMIVKGAAKQIMTTVRELGGTVPAETEDVVNSISQDGGTALVVAELINAPEPGSDPREATANSSLSRVLGVIHLKDIVKDGMVERFKTLREMGIRTVMITGDNELTAQAIAKEAGVDDVLAEATPDQKLALIKKEQAGGHMVAMTGDGTNDAPALAQADVGVAMNTGTTAAKEAGNMVDLDSDPTKLIDIVGIGKQLLITRGSLTTFSIANDVAKYFAILPAMFITAFPGLQALNIMHLHSPTSAILSAVIFNALIIVALIPLALKGVSYRPASASALLRRNLLIFGLGGFVAPFIGIKIIDLIIGNGLGI